MCKFILISKGIRSLIAGIFFTNVLFLLYSADVFAEEKLGLVNYITPEQKLIGYSISEKIENINSGESIWSKRYGHQAVVLNDSVFILGGMDDNGLALNDVWRSDDLGITWAQVISDAEWPPRREHKAVVVNGAIFLMGGKDKNALRDIWRSDDEGRTWYEIEVETREFIRQGVLEQVLAMDDSIIAIKSKGTWESNDGGRTWGKIKEGVSRNLYGYKAIALDNNIIALGGYSISNTFNHIFQNKVYVSKKSDVSWYPARRSKKSWSKRDGHQAVASAGELFVMGGRSNRVKLLNDVWRSVDGEDWIKVKNNSPWTRRRDHQVASLDGSLILMGGRNRAGRALNDVWRSVDGGETWHVVIHSAAPDIFSYGTESVKENLINSAAENKFPIQVNYDKYKHVINDKEELFTKSLPFLWLAGIGMEKKFLNSLAISENKGDKFIVFNNVAYTPSKIVIGDGANPYSWLLNIFPYSRPTVDNLGNDNMERAIQYYVGGALDSYLTLEDMPASPIIPEPNFPPEPIVSQGEYESKSLFEERIEEARISYINQINTMQTEYRAKVDIRNKEIDRRNIIYENRRAKVELMKTAFIGAVLPEIIGEIKVRRARYDQENDRILIDIYSTQGGYRDNVFLSTFEKSPESVKALIDDLADSQLIATFTISSENFALDEISFNIKGETVAGILHDISNVPDSISGRVVNRSVSVQVDIESIENFIQSQKQSPNLKGYDGTLAIKHTDKRGNSKTIGDPNLARKVSALKTTKKDPNKHLVVIGIENYNNINNVPYAINSAELISDLMSKKFGILASNVHFMKDPTGSYLIGNLRNILAALGKDDILYFYYAGHGFPDAETKFEDVFMVPSDVVKGSYKSQDMRFSSIVKNIEEHELKKAYIFLDTCFSGSGSGEFDGVAPVVAPEPDIYVPDNVVVFYGGKSDEYANSYDDKGHRLFGYFLAESILAGKKKASQLSDYLSKRVKQVSAKNIGADFVQTPYFEGEDDKIY